MKKISYAVLSASILITFFAACGKSSVKPVESTTAAGYWFTSTTTGAAWNGGMLLKSNGTTRVYDFYSIPTSTDTTKAYIGNGTWKIKGDSVYLTTIYSNGQTFTGTGYLDLKSTPNVIDLPGVNNHLDIWVKQ
jgi:hypothetical protein